MMSWIAVFNAVAGFVLGFVLGRLSERRALSPTAPDEPKTKQQQERVYTLDDAYFTSLIPDQPRKGIIVTTCTGERYLVVGIDWHTWPACEAVVWKDWQRRKSASGSESDGYVDVEMLRTRLKSQLLRAALPSESSAELYWHLVHNGSVRFEDSSDRIEVTGYRSTATARHAGSSASD